MVLVFFTMIVFIAEIIILIAAVITLLRLDKVICNANSFIIEVKPKIENITTLVRKISQQLVILSSIWVDNFHKKKEKFIIEQIKNILTTLLFWRINIKVIKKLRKSKLIKLVSKGFNLLQNVI